MHTEHFISVFLVFIFISFLTFSSFIKQEQIEKHKFILNSVIATVMLMLLYIKLLKFKGLMKMGGRDNEARRERLFFLIGINVTCGPFFFFLLL